jgi:dipeptidyl aminopeptidase/acylaminoacyl peptidase
MRSLWLSIVSLLFACAGENTGAPPPAVAPPRPPPSASVVQSASSMPAPHADATLIPRRTFFSTAGLRTYADVSPDGKWIAFNQDVDGVLNVEVAPWGDLSKAKGATHDKRPVFNWVWAASSDTILYLQDTAGEANLHVYAASVATGETKDLTPYDGISARLQLVSPQHPGEVLIAMNDRDRKSFDLYRVDIRTGGRKLVEKNDGGFGAPGAPTFLTDDDFRVRLASKAVPDGSVTYLVPGPKGTFDSTAFTVPFGDTKSMQLLGLDPAGRTLYLVDARGRDTAGLFAMDLAGKKETLLADDPKADVQEVMSNPLTHKPFLATVDYDRQRRIVVDPTMKTDEDYLSGLIPGASHWLHSCSLDMKRCIAEFEVSDGPSSFYAYDRTKKKAELLFVHRPALLGLELAKMTTRIITARDGLSLVVYVTLPPSADPDGDGMPDHPLPTVVRPHEGGPWWRDAWGWNRDAVWLANRGYAVVSVNYRGSIGYGKKFGNAGDREYGGKMYDDVIDTVRWAQQKGVADPQRTAIFGDSFGGFHALLGLGRDPDTFACGVDEFGIADLASWAAAVPNWMVSPDDVARRVGDWRTEEGKKLLAAQSPITYASAIKRPLLVAQGLNDVSVKPEQSEGIVKLVQQNGVPVTYLTFSDEGHVFRRPESLLAFDAIMETFLAQCLGGSYQPVRDDFKGANLAVPVGADKVYGLADALKSK